MCKKITMLVSETIKVDGVMGVEYTFTNLFWLGIKGMFVFMYLITSSN